MNKEPWCSDQTGDLYCKCEKYFNQAGADISDV